MGFLNWNKPPRDKKTNEVGIDNAREAFGEPPEYVPPAAIWHSPTFGTKEVATINEDLKSVFASQYSGGEAIEHVTVTFVDGTKDSIPVSQLEVMATPAGPAAEEKEELLLTEKYLEPTGGVSFKNEKVEIRPAPGEEDELLLTNPEPSGGVSFRDEEIEIRPIGGKKEPGTALVRTGEKKQPEAQKEPSPEEIEQRVDEAQTLDELFTLIPSSAKEELSSALSKIKEQNKEVSPGKTLKGINSVTREYGLRRAVERILREEGNTESIPSELLLTNEREAQTDTPDVIELPDQSSAPTEQESPEPEAEPQVSKNLPARVERVRPLPGQDIEDAEFEEITPAYERALKREEQANELAEKYGLGDERKAFLDAEKQFSEAFLRNKGELGGDFPEDVLKNYMRAAKEWRNGLASKTAEADGPDRIKARILGFRDTSMRYSELKQSLKEQLAEEKSKSVFNKMKGWAAAGGRGLLWAGAKYGAASEKVGRAIGAGVIGRNVLGTEERGARMARIAGSAAMVSVIAGVATGGVAAIPVAAAFALRVARGVGAAFFAVPLGTAAGGAVGGLYRGFAERGNAQARENFFKIAKDTNAGTITDLADIEGEAAAFTKGRFATLGERRAKQERVRRTIEVGMGSAFAVGMAAGPGQQVAEYLIDEDLFKDVNAVNTALTTMSPPEEQAMVYNEPPADITPAEQRAQMRDAVNALNQMSGTEESGNTVQPSPVANASTEQAGARNAAADAATNAEQNRTTTSPETPRSSTTPDAPTQSARVVETEITRGQGADAAFRNLREDVADRLRNVYGGNTSMLSHAERAILNANSEHTLSTALGFYGDVHGPNGEVIGQGSRIMQPGDTIEIDRQGRLVFIRDGVSQTIIEANGTFKELSPLSTQNATGFTSTPTVETPPAGTRLPENESGTAPESPRAEPATPVTTTIPASVPGPATVPVNQGTPPPSRSINEFVNNARAGRGIETSGSSGVMTPPGESPGTSGPSAGAPPSIDEYVRRQAGVTAAEATQINAHGVEINPAESHIYTHVDARGNTVFTMYGGTNSAEAAVQYLREHPNAVVRYEVTSSNGEVDTAEVFMNKQGAIVRNSPITGSDGRLITRLNPGDFTSRGTFTYRP